MMRDTVKHTTANLENEKDNDFILPPVRGCLVVVDELTLVITGANKFVCCAMDRASHWRDARSVTPGGFGREHREARFIVVATIAPVGAKG
jgi:hypothetical protein